MKSAIFTVKEFNELVSIVLQEKVGEVSVQGEVSGYQVRQNKWISFDLKDTDSVVNCFATTYQIDMPLTDGMEVVVTGTPRLYVPYGKFSFNVRNVQLKGEGALKKAFEDLKAKLDAQGLFSPAHKQALPRFPEKIGIITSGEGAAVNDITKVINGRWGGLKIYLVPVLVQGKNAPDELVGALNYFNQRFPVDVILFGRGGGSLEDLQAFNSERVARAIFASKIPVVAGIGHEHNTSIADLVADMRAATPSNAAELAVPDRREIAREIDFLRHQSEQTIRRKLDRASQNISQSRSSLQLFIGQQVAAIRTLIGRFKQTFVRSVSKIELESERINLLRTRLVRSIAVTHSQAKQQLHEYKRVLSALNPTAILSRGYSITYAASNGTVITSVAQLPPDGRIKTQVRDGIFEATTSVSRSKKSVAKPIEKSQESLF